jgi:hypothetical protein
MATAGEQPAALVTDGVMAPFDATMLAVGGLADVGHSQWRIGEKAASAPQVAGPFCVSASG